MALVFKGASPQSHVKHKRKYSATKNRHSQNFTAFLGVHATRLSTTAANLAALFAAPKNRTAEQIRVATSYSASDIHGF